MLNVLSVRVFLTHFKRDYDEEQEYLAAERAGVWVDSHPSTRTLKVEHFEGTDLVFAGAAQKVKPKKRGR